MIVRRWDKKKIVSKRRKEGAAQPKESQKTLLLFKQKWKKGIC
jgi:hypothetical protein